MRRSGLLTRLFLIASQKVKTMKPHIAHVDDGSILFEWIAKDRRFGIVIDKNNIKESSWFYVNKDGTNECGDLPEELLSYFITPN